ncbi:MAG TPA: dihydrolipoamide acetyltransferase family protein [Rubrobacteraceae bacterium]|nr:dihydrolipoamide acetyltransferase family protein [Rubrobacteraceae bacterium]
MIMPKMGDAMEEGTLVKWLKSEGDEVSEGDPIAEIETDKVTLELEAEDSGTLAQLIADEGQDIPVGEAIAFIAGEGEEVPERAAGGGAEEAEEEGGEGEAQAQTATETEAPEEEGGEEAPAQADGRTDGHFRASPIVRRLAQENNLDLSRIEGSGPAGRIVERDVRAAMESGTAQKTDGKAGVEAPEREAAPQVAAAPEPTRAPGTELVEPSRMRRVIGERMTQSKQQVPHYYATVEVEMNDLLALRKQLNEQLEEQGIKLSINDFVMKAVALALKDFPNLNALWTSEGIELHQQVDLAMAVALEEGLITPVIRDAANKTLSAISAASKDLARRAREGELKPEEYQGGTVTVSNMGMFGVESFAAIINPPQAAIVAVSSIMQRAMFKDDEVVPVSIMKLTLSADHRISNGAEGGRYLAEVKRLLERPMTLVV